MKEHNTSLAIISDYSIYLLQGVFLEFMGTQELV
jgi:hypothetical protein